MIKNNLNKLLNRVKRNCNKYIQLRDLIKTSSGEILAKCIACKRMWIINTTYDLKNFHASHYFNDNDYNSVRFDEVNENGCCARCNTPSKIGGMSGNLAEYQIGLIDKWGEKEFDELKIRKDQIKKWSYKELEELNKYFLEKIKIEKIRLGRNRFEQKHLYEQEVEMKLDIKTYLLFIIALMLGLLLR